MNRFELISFTDADRLAQLAASGWLKEVLRTRISGAVSHSVAFSGGRIYLRFFDAVVHWAIESKMSFANVHFFWADERCVPPNDPESNFAAADKHFFQPLGIAADKIHRIRGEDAPEEAAALATAEIKRVVPLNKDGQPLLDIVFLGMGEDGHIASLFPDEPESVKTDKSIYRAIQNSPKPPPNRVTLGYAAIAAAKQVFVLASGAGKEAALRESLRPDGKTPLARVIQLREQTKIFTDIHLT